MNKDRIELTLHHTACALATFVADGFDEVLGGQEALIIKNTNSLRGVIATVTLVLPAGTGPELQQIKQVLLDKSEQSMLPFRAVYSEWNGDTERAITVMCVDDQFNVSV